MMSRTLWAFVFLASLLMFGPAQAQDRQVTLQSEDGSIRLLGELTGFDGQSYTVQTTFGAVSVEKALVSCDGPGCPVDDTIPGEIVISGSNGLATALMPALIDGFSFRMDADMTVAPGDDSRMRRIGLTTYDGDPLAEIALNGRGSSQGLRDLASGAATLALTTRPAREAERQAMVAAGLGALTGQPFETVLALDGLLVVTAPANPIRALSARNIADIFAGRITNWSQLGGADAPITVYSRPADSGTGAVFRNLVMRPARLEVTPQARSLESDTDVSDAVAADPNGIGITSFSSERGARSVAIRGVCGLQTPATAFTIKTEEYPLTRRLFVYRPDRPLPEVADAFVDFLSSDIAQAIVARTGFVDQGTSAVSVNNMGLRFVAAMLPSDAEVALEDLRGMMRDLIAADRLSITFRFAQGSSRLDSRAEADVQRLAALIDRGDFKGKEVVLIGFTDSVGRPDINLTLSQQRAAQVRDAVQAASQPAALDELTLSAQGYGEMSPLGCNETANGRRINRRVEVWIRDIIRE